MPKGKIGEKAAGSLKTAVDEAGEKLSDKVCKAVSGEEITCP